MNKRLLKELLEISSREYRRDMFEYVGHISDKINLLDDDKKANVLKSYLSKQLDLILKLYNIVDEKELLDLIETSFIVAVIIGINTKDGKLLKMIEEKEKSEQKLEQFVKESEPDLSYYIR